MDNGIAAIVLSVNICFTVFYRLQITCCFRYVARKQLDELAEMGYTMLSGIENEFMLYQKGTKLPLHTGHDFCVTATTGKFACSLVKYFRRKRAKFASISTIEADPEQQLWIHPWHYVTFRKGNEKYEPSDLFLCKGDIYCTPILSILIAKKNIQHRFDN